ncbi:AI-2E family transporter [Capnocytophaga cynodegmi]|uniref:AI-2E family transporter n=1 Tax=Capnocytophaga cynodegmi TaxID=28189 RepID=UPI001ACB5A54|nr:AI-2E family transporter [Capnocytophaga cynodegmi]GIM54476.1 AI-2E family transporter [Capnocytophaga cynodegmi]
MKNTITFPFYARLAFTLLGIVLIFFIFYLGRDIIVPLVMALLFAILLRPINRFFNKKCRFPNTISSLVTIFLFVVLILGIATFISVEIGGIASDTETIVKNIETHWARLQRFVTDFFGISKVDQSQHINMVREETKSALTSSAAMLVTSFSDVLFSMAMIPIYAFLFLLYQNHLITFLSKLIGEGDQQRLKNILFNIKTAVQSYLIGICLQVLSIAALTAIGLSIVGVQNAILLGVITGILGLIPYLGNLLACAITILATLSGSPDLSLILGVVIVSVVVQIIDNNILVPLVVSSKVEINAFASIIGILVGGSLAGIGGMFLAIPIIAILKVIFDNVPSLNPWGYLLGDDLPKIPQWYKKVKHLKTIAEEKKANKIENLTQEKPTSESVTPSEEK